MRDVQFEMRLPDIGKPPQRDRRLDRRTVADLQAADPAREVGDPPLDFEIHVAERHVPIPQTGGEPRDVVGREPRTAQRRGDLHLAEEIPVFGPRVADQRDVGDAERGVARDDLRVLEPEAALRHVETAREAVEFETAPLTGRKAFDRGVDGLAVDGEVLDEGRHAVEVHVREVDAELRVAAVETFQAEVHVRDRGVFQRQPEVPLPHAVGIRDAVHQLFDVHLPGGCLPQVEPGIGDRPAAERQPAAQDAEAGDVGVQMTHVEQRIALVILDIEALHADLREEPDVHPVDRNGGFQTPRHDLRSLVHHEVLHGGNVEQQRPGQRKNYQQQHRRREHHSQYFYTFAHRSTVTTCVITCKVSENS